MNTGFGLPVVFAENYGEAMSTSIDAQQLTTLLRISSELDVIGDVTVATPSERHSPSRRLRYLSCDLLPHPSCAGDPRSLVLD
jgi:hypothetical protein